MEGIIDEGEIKGAINSLTIKETEKILKQMKTSICKIYGKLIGTGFFCSINYNDDIIPCLMTNYHILDEQYIKKYKKIKISMNDNCINEELLIKEKDILYLSQNNEYDLIIINLNKKENYINYLKLDDNLFNNNSELGYNDQSIYILHYPNATNVSVSYGYGIDSSEEYCIIHKCNTLPGSSGGPILNLLTKKVIGIHRAFLPQKRFNIGTLLKYPLNKLINENNRNNFIISEVKIKEEDVDKKIRIINSYENFKRENDWKNDIDEYKYKNEKEIEKCIIIINNLKISFSYYYRFKEVGIYEIKYIFKNSLNSLSCLFWGCDYLSKLNLTHFNTYNSTNMFCMFRGCSSLSNLDLSSFQTQNVSNMVSLFSNCISLSNINISNFNTKNVIDMRSMFRRCKSLRKLDLSHLNTKNVINMSYMFEGCNLLSNLNLSNFTSENVIYMYYMFHGCDSLLKQNVIADDIKILNELN